MARALSMARSMRRWRASTLKKGQTNLDNFPGGTACSLSLLMGQLFWPACSLLARACSFVFLPAKDKKSPRREEGSHGHHKPK
jgi:hypothetical protein